MNAYFNQYRATQVQTASPEQILVMLYDGAIRFVCQGREAMAQGQIAKKSEVIGRAVAIVTELSNTLDHEIGGEVAENLDALYNFMARELTRANLKNDPQPLDAVENILSELREAWVEAIQIVKHGNPQAGAEQAKPLSAAL